MGVPGRFTTLLVSAGGKGSGIFDESGPVQTRPRLNPPGARPVTFSGPPSLPPHPRRNLNKPKARTALREQT